MRKMGIGLGVGINRSNYAQGIFNAYSARVVADGGVVESGTCVDAVSSLLQSASLLLIPSGYKGGKLYSEIPTNGNGDLTWTRGGDAFRTNASGVIQRVPWNLLKQSEDFSNISSWTQDPTSGSITITANYATAPNGTNTADRIQITKGVSYSQLYQTSSVISGAVYTISVYLKSLSGTPTITTLYDGGAKGTQTLTTDWVRYTFSFTATSSTVYPMIALYSGNSASMDILAWGYQLVEGTTAQTYLPTTDRLNFPRLSYMYGSCPSALLEPQRTNLALYSEQFDNLYWQGGGIMTSVTANTTTAPNGTTTADTAVVNATYNNASRAIVAGITNATIYTLSVYVKKSASGGASNVRLSVNNTLSWTGAASQKVALTTDWQRVTLTWTSNASVQAYFIIGSVDNTGASDSTCYGNIDIWGAQMEVGSYPTTYIPTTSATATRVADSFSRNNIYTNGLISASGGTWFVELRNNVAMVGDAGGDAIFLGDINNTGGNNFRLYNPPSSSRVQIFKTISSAATPIYTTTSDTVKIAIKWNGSTADVFANGTKVVSATAFTTTAMEYIVANITGVPKFIQQMALFNTPLTDAQCQTLTT